MKLAYILLLLLLVPFLSTGNSPKEELNYSIRFGLLKGGVATITTSCEQKDEKNLIFSEMKIKSTGLAHSLYYLENTYSSVIDPITCLPEKSTCNLHEQGYEYFDEVHYFQTDSSLFSKRQGWFNTEGNMLEIVSLIYHFRFSEKLSGFKPGDKMNIVFWDGNKIYVLQLNFSGFEVVKTGAGKFRCIKMEPVFKAGSAFSKKAPLTLWISDDSRKLPVLIRLNFKVGSAKCELENF